MWFIPALESVREPIADAIESQTALTTAALIRALVCPDVVLAVGTRRICRSKVLDDSGIATSPVMAMALPRSFRITVDLFVIERLNTVWRGSESIAR